MGLAVGLAAASVALSAAGTYAAVRGQQNQAKMDVQSQRLKQEQLGTERQMIALQAREQEGERQRRADLTTSAGMAGAAAAGFDYWLSPTAQTMDAENQQQVAGDISAIRLLGNAKLQRNMLEGRGAQMTESAYAATGSNAWISPTFSLLGRRLAMYQAAMPIGGVTPSSIDPNRQAPNGEAR